jgi:hypothetical protein
VGDAQVAFEVITTVIVEGFASDVVVYVELVAKGIFVPLRCHWYVGEAPPFVGVAVNVTEVPALEHIDVDDELILTVGINVAFTVKVLELEVVPHEPPLVVRVKVTVAGAVADAV